jgi:hypothetical protein
MEVTGQLHATSAVHLGDYPWYLLNRTESGPRAGLTTSEERKIACLHWQSKPDFCVLQAAASHYTHHVFQLQPLKITATSVLLCPLLCIVNVPIFFGALQRSCLEWSPRRRVGRPFPHTIIYTVPISS